MTKKIYTYDDIMSISRDETLNQLVSGKTICIVGPSTHIMGLGLGNYIDNYDIVCRLNDLVPVNYMKDYGMKCDILFHVFNDLEYEWKEFREYIDNNYWVWQRIKLIVCAAYSTKPHGPFNKEMFELYDIYSEGYEKKPITYFTKEDNLILRKELWDFNTGLVALLMLLKCDIKELFYTGISFYLENFLEERKSCFYPGKSEYYDGIFDKNHDLEQLRDVFRLILSIDENKRKIKIDDFLRDEVLCIDYENVKEINYDKELWKR